jgi:hypothetical protein
MGTRVQQRFAVALTAGAILLGGSVVIRSQARVPKIWDDAALADWATPIAALGLRPGHYTSAEYYKVPADNLRTYPVYVPGKEPARYWDWLQKQKPQPLVDASTIRTKDDWIRAGKRAFRDLDKPPTRTGDPALIALARNPTSFEGVRAQADGSVLDVRWVVTDTGVQLTTTECGSCHLQVLDDDTVLIGGPAGRFASEAHMTPPGVPVTRLVATALTQQFEGDPFRVAAWRAASTPWAPDARVEHLKDEAVKLGPVLAGIGGGVVFRTNGSPYFGTKIPDLHILHYSRYIDATGTHRLRGPEDVARYAALINSADSMDFGSYHILTPEQRHVRYRYADEVLYAIGTYVMSLEPPKNPNPPPAALVTRGQQVFKREKCAGCHPAPTYTTGELTPALEFDVPFDHPNFSDIRDRSVGTDPGLALRTRKGTGFYKIPSLRGLWYRPRLLHDGSLVSLDELFDGARLDPDYERKGWRPFGVTKGAIPGLEFLTKLSPEDKRALIAFLRSL